MTWHCIACAHRHSLVRAACSRAGWLAGRGALLGSAVFPAEQPGMRERGVCVCVWRGAYSMLHARQFAALSDRSSCLPRPKARWRRVVFPGRVIPRPAPCTRHTAHGSRRVVSCGASSWVRLAGHARRGPQPPSPRAPQWCRYTYLMIYTIVGRCCCGLCAIAPLPAHAQRALSGLRRTWVHACTRPLAGGGPGGAARPLPFSADVVLRRAQTHPGSN